MTRLDPDDLRVKYADWRQRIAQMHDHARPVTNETVSLHRPTMPMEQWRVGLFTTAGAYLDGQAPFDVSDPHGDPSIRLIPGDAGPDRFRFAHSHYDTSRAEDDPNVVLPLGPLHDLVRDGEVGSVSPVHVGMMGWNPDPARVVDESAPAVVEAFAGADVDVVVMSPG